MLACFAGLLQLCFLRGADELHAVLMRDCQLEQRYVALGRLPEFLPGQLDLLLQREAVPRASQCQLAAEIEKPSVTPFPLHQGQSVPVCET